MKKIAYICCALSYIMLFAIIILTYYGCHIWKTNYVSVLIAVVGWTIASIYEYRNDKYGKR